MKTIGEETAWAAGLFEGEGTVFHSCRAIQTVLSMTDLEPVEDFHRIVGVGKLYGPYDNGPGRKIFWRWSCCTKRDALVVFEKFKPWLSPRRIAQFEKALVTAPETRVPRYIHQVRSGKWTATAPGTPKRHLGTYETEQEALSAVAQHMEESTCAS